ncbi:MAG: carboxypeptidase regulatory-like domain-containing protein, partial [Leptospiraceae bacterium]|nr:carboxypeptidase regulatory-like domain-containing protein [Leptospiraceae bacterium]
MKIKKYFFLFLLFLLPQLSTADGKNDKKIIPTKDILTGTILEKNKKTPIAGAVVEIKNKNLGVGYYKTTTDKEGNFKIDDFLTQIDYNIEIIADGYVTYTGNLKGNNYKFYLQKEVVVYGKVLNSKQEPLEGVEVQGFDYYSYGRARKTFIARTDKNGEYSLAKLPSSTYNLSFSKTGFITETAITQNIGSGEKFRLPMQLFHPAGISGKLSIDLEGEKEPARNVQVQLSGKANHVNYSFDNGYYNIEDIKPGNYKVSYIHRGFEKLVIEDLEIKEGQKIQELNQSLKPLEPF